VTGGDQRPRRREPADAAAHHRHPHPASLAPDAPAAAPGARSPNNDDTPGAAACGACWW